MRRAPKFLVFKSQYLRRGLFDFAPFGSGALWVYLQEMYSNKVVVGPYIFNLEIGIPQPLIARLYAGALSFTVERSFFTRPRLIATAERPHIKCIPEV